MGAGEHKERAVKDIGFALVTVSDTRSNRDDHSGDLMKEMVVAAGHRVVSRSIVPDERHRIHLRTEELFDDDRVDAVIFCGGTGISKRDITIESVLPLMDKELVGFGEVFRTMSLDDIGSAAIMTRPQGQ